SVQHFSPGVFGIEKADIDRRLRMVVDEAAQQRRQPVQADVVAGGEVEPTIDSRVEVAQGAARVLHLAEDAARAWQQRTAGFGQGNFAADAIEQASLQMLLQCRDAL